MLLATNLRSLENATEPSVDDPKHVGGMSPLNYRDLKQGQKVNHSDMHLYVGFQQTGGR